VVQSLNELLCIIPIPHFIRSYKAVSDRQTEIYPWCPPSRWQLQCFLKHWMDLKKRSHSNPKAGLMLHILAVEN